VTTHRLKTWPDAFEPTWVGDKVAEIRVNDRDYRRGDLLVLREWLPRSASYTGREVRAQVTHVLPAPCYGVPENYAMLSLRLLGRGVADCPACRGLGGECVPCPACGVERLA